MLENYSIFVLMYKGIRRIFNNVSIFVGKGVNILTFKMFTNKKIDLNYVKNIPIILDEPKIIEVKEDVDKLKQGYIGLWVDTLDKGGIEQVIAFLAEGLRESGVQVKVLCNISGGIVASSLKELGIDVYIFNNNKEEFEEFLKRNKPVILSSHYIHNFIDIPQKLGIKVIETIHNMYAYHDNFAWKEEFVRTKYFEKMIAVSSLVKKYYIAWNKEYDSRDIIVIGNAGDPKRVEPTINKKALKEELAIKENEFIFLNTASFDPRKNQLGMMSAFELIYKNVSKDIKLILLGNTRRRKIQKSNGKV